MFEQIIPLKVKQKIDYKEYKILSKLLRIFACLVCERKKMIKNHEKMIA